MIASLSDIWMSLDRTDTAPAPRPKRRTSPVLIGDILTARGDRPEFLTRWKDDQQALNDD